MTYLKTINTLNNTFNQTFKSRTKTWAEVNDGRRVTFNTNIQTKFKTTSKESHVYGFMHIYL